MKTLVHLYRHWLALMSVLYLMTWLRNANVQSGVGHTDTSPEEIYNNLNSFPTTTGLVRSHTIILEDFI